MTQDNKGMAIQWTEPCTCLQLQGYDSVKQWWELRETLKHKKNLSQIFGDVQKAFEYRQAFEIVKHDSRIVMEECKADHTDLGDE